MSGGWTRRELAAACTSAALAALQACGRETREPAGGSPAKSGTLALTHGKADLRTPRDAPPGETWVYGLALPFQVAPRLGAVFCNIKGARGNDFEAGNDAVLFDAIEDGIRAAVPLARNHRAPHPRGKGDVLMVKYPARGGFVPFGTRRPDGSPHPHAGTGFGIHQSLAWPVDGPTEIRGPEHYQCFELQQYRYDGSAFRVLGTEKVEMTDLLAGWTIHDGGITNGIPDGDDFLVGMAGGKFDPRKLEENNGGDVASGAGVMRWQRRQESWRPVSFVPVTEPDLSFEPSLIRDTDGALLFCARGGQRAIRVWRSSDGGATWVKLIHVVGVAAGSPISLDQAVDGTPYIATNLYDVLLHPVAAKYRVRKNTTG
ncbi:MAG: hypothetical protein DMG07_28390, partial [Acidobacteria bacterium]